MSYRSCLGDKRSISISTIVSSPQSLPILLVPSRFDIFPSPRRNFAFLRRYCRLCLPVRPKAVIGQHLRPNQFPDCQNAPPWIGHRFQHTQAVKVDESDTIAEENESNEIQADKLGDARDDDLAPAPEESSVTSNPAQVLRSQQLFKAIGRYLPFAGPSTVLKQVQPNENEEDYQCENVRFSLQLLNAEFDIQCTREFAAAGQDQISMNRIYGDIVSEYVKKIKDCLMSKDIDGLNEPFDMPKMRNALRMEPLTVSVTRFQIDSNAEPDCQLFRAQVYSGNEPLGQAQIWPHHGIAERMARNSADADTLTRARQQGLSIAAFRSSVSSGSNRTIAKKKSFDLELIDDKNGPAVYDVPLNQSCLSAMLQFLRDARTAGLPDEVTLRTLHTESGPFHLSRPMSQQLRKASKRLKLNLMRLKSSPGFQKIQREQSKLPIRQPAYASQICKLVKENDVVVLVSETGSGKTTQLPQLLLEDAILSDVGATCNVVCTQPRRIAATSVAKRVAYERSTTVGGSVGHQVRFDHKRTTEKGTITYTTAGVLLRNLQDDAERIFRETSHIVVDEIHERDLTVDLLMAVLRDAARKRLSQHKPCPKIILMSATMKSVDFEQYFANVQSGSGLRVGSITIPGRAYSVTTKSLDKVIPELASLYSQNHEVMQLLQSSQEYLEWEDDFIIEQKRLQTNSIELNTSTEDNAAMHPQATGSDPFRDAAVPYPLMAATIAHILATSSEGDILVFLPGMREIDQLANLLATISIHGQVLKDSEKVHVFKLHSVLHETNSDVFKPISEGDRRIILSTNIAQTSITLPDVVHVVDSGKRREMRYDSVLRKNEFVSTWIDKATSLQRKGRAGRVQNGYYWAMFTEARFESMLDKASPEILISDLTTASLILKSHSSELNLEEFFSKTLDPPDPMMVVACIQELQEMGMLTSAQAITPLGKFCSDFPLHPAKARGLLFGILFDCFLPLMITASHDVDSPLIHSTAQRKDMHYANLAFAGIADDDRYAFINAFQQYDEAIRDGLASELASLEKRHVRRDVYRDMQFVGQQLYGILLEYGFLPRHRDYEDQLPRKGDSVFQKLMGVHNRNADQTNLFKAIALTVNDTNLAVWNEKEQAWVVKNMKCMLRPYGVNTMQSLKLLTRMPYRRSGEVVTFTSMVRNVLSSTRPSLVETSTITPVTAILFGGPIALVDEDTIEIDGWLRYKLSVTTDTRSDTALRSISPAAIVVEFRKAIDRFLVLAFNDLRNVSRLSYAQRRSNVHNRMFKSNVLRETMITGLINVLNLDAQQWDETVHFGDRDGK